MKFKTCSLAFIAILIGSLAAIPGNLFGGDGHGHGNKSSGSVHVKDYVSGETFSKDDAAASSKHKGVTFYFDSKENKKMFASKKTHFFKLASEDFHFYTNQAFAHYFHIQSNLAGDSVDGVNAAASTVAEALGTAMYLRPGLGKKEFGMYQKNLKLASESAAKLAKAGDMKSMRNAFWPLSEAMIAFSKQFNSNSAHGTAAFLFHCGMARNGKGGSWLQAENKIANPYYGSMMLRCGKQKASHLPLCLVSGEELEDAEIRVTHQDKAYYLCCKDCIKKFNADPKKYTQGQAAGDIWTCPMHAEIQEKEAGKCPKCGMPLVKKGKDAGGHGGHDGHGHD